MIIFLVYVHIQKLFKNVFCCSPGNFLSDFILNKRLKYRLVRTAAIGIFIARRLFLLCSFAKKILSSSRKKIAVIYGLFENSNVVLHLHCMYTVRSRNFVFPHIFLETTLEILLYSLTLCFVLSSRI